MATCVRFEHLEAMSVDRAESLIISSLFKSAAREAQSVLEAPDTQPDIKLRAAYVLLQSLYELNRCRFAVPPPLGPPGHTRSFSSTQPGRFAYQARILVPATMSWFVRRLGEAASLLAASYADSRVPLGLAILWCDTALDAVLICRPSCKLARFTASSCAALLTSFPSSE